MSKENYQAATILEDAETKDGLENLIAQLGTEQDKRHHSKFVNNKRLSDPGNRQELDALYRTDWLAGKVVDIIPNDMTREWRLFTKVETATAEMLRSEEDRLGVVHKFNLAHKWARLYGTAFIVLAVDDGLEPDKPLNIASIKKGGLRHINVIDRHRISTGDQTPIADPMNSKFGMPEFYRFAETSVRIHHSRVLRFDGVQLPYDEFRRNNYFSDSVLDRLYDSLINFNTVTQGTASMVFETNVDIVKVKGLMQYLQTAEGEALLRKRFTLAGMLKSFNNMMLLDNEEEFQTKTNTFAGLPDLIARYGHILASAADVPATRLLGEAASGFNATGEGDLKNYYDKIKADQITEYKPKLDYFDDIMAASLGLSENLDLSYDFKPLFQMTPEQQATLEKTRAERDKLYYDMNVIDEVIIAKELQQDSTYTNVTEEYVKELESYVNEQPETPTEVDDPKIAEEAPEEQAETGEDS